MEIGQLLYDGWMIKFPIEAIDEKFIDNTGVTDYCRFRGRHRSGHWTNFENYREQFLIV